jgi:putative aldouronate transport system permease protein
MSVTSAKYDKNEIRNTAKIKKKRKEGKLIFNASRDVPMYILLLPAVLILIIFIYIPIYGVTIAFKDFSPYKGYLRSSWVGFKHFKYFLLDSTFWQVMRNTIYLNFLNLIWGFPAPIVFALLLNEITRTKLKKTVQTISYLPYFISWVVAASIITSVLSPTTGILNKLIVSLFGIEPIYFLAKKEYFRAIIVMADIWKGIGMGAVYYISAITQIDQELYEAAKIDGAGKWRQTWHITLPGISGIVTVLFILRIGSMITIGFENIFLLYNPVVYSVADVISTYTYRLGIEGAQFSLTSAIGLTQSIVNFILVFSANRTARRLAGWSLW